MITGDIAGSMVGWKMDGRGQLLMMFHHELKHSFTHIAFKISPPKPAVDMRYTLDEFVNSGKYRLSLHFYF